MTAEEVRVFREAAQVLLTLLRCISMKKALAATESDPLNFFRLYDGCLTDVAVISWCKLFGSKKENLYWERLFPETCVPVRKHLCDEFRIIGLEQLSMEIRNYRDTYVAHHDLDDAKRAKQHPELGLLKKTGWLLYNEVFHTLETVSQNHRLRDPSDISGSNLSDIESHWHEIVVEARKATNRFTDSPC